MSRRLLRLSSCGALAVLSTVALALASSPASAASARSTRVSLRSTGRGKILANGAGFTLYMFTRDKKNQDSCVKISNCTAVWPVLKTSGRPLAGKGVKASLLGTITLAGGVKQVTYAGHALYGYAGDSSPGETGYVGFPQFGGTWDALNAAGKIVR